MAIVKPGDVLVVTLEAAMGADLTANPNTWTWTDLSSRLKGQATITRGRADEAQQTQPATLTIRLGNNDGWLTPRHPSSQWYLLWAVGTPVRLKVTIPGDATYIRMQGRVTIIKPVWPAGNSDVAFVDVTVKGALYNLQQGSPPLRSALYRSISTSSPVAYWSLEDGAAATQAASGLLGGAPLALAAGSVKFAGKTGPGGSAPLADFSSGGTMTGSVPAGSATSWRVEFVTLFNPLAFATDFVAALQWTTQGTIGLWEIDVTGLPDGLYIQYLPAGSGTSVVFTSGKKVDDGLWHHIRITGDQSGSNLNIVVYLDGVAVITKTIASTTNGQVTGVTINPVGAPNNEVPTMGHLTVWAPYAASINTVSAFTGYTGETATARLTRLCAEQGVPLAITGTSDIKMGPQPTDTLYNIARQCEDADGGILTDGLNAGLNYLARSGRYNQPVALALDANQAQIKWPPFEPLEDDQRLRTKFTASRVNGSSATFLDPSAKTRGEYPGQANLSLADDSTLAAQASWRTHLFTVPEMRTPVMVIDVRNSPELLTPWLTADIGKRYTAANPPVQYPPGGLDLVLEQYVEVIDGITWRTQLTGSPYAPWRAFVVNTDRVDGDGYTLAAGVNATATTLSVASTTGLLWVTNVIDPGAFPFDVEVAGIRLRVTNISGTSSPQTFTVTRSMDGFDKSLPINSPVRLWRPPVIAL